MHLSASLFQYRLAASIKNSAVSHATKPEPGSDVVKETVSNEMNGSEHC
jgi:hypothetical protein